MSDKTEATYHDGARMDRIALGAELEAISDRLSLEAVQWATISHNTHAISRARRQIEQLAEVTLDFRLDPDLDTARAFAGAGAILADNLGSVRRFIETGAIRCARRSASECVGRTCSRS